MMELKPTVLEDLEVFFINQTDEEANYMAAFTPENPFDKEAYIKKWTRLLYHEDIHMQSVHFEGKVIGCMIKFMMGDDAEITYATSKEYWRKGITSRALIEFVKLEQHRPLHAHVAFDNIGSRRVLEKAGFVCVGKEKGFANARKKEIVEFVYKLD